LMAIFRSQDHSGNLSPARNTGRQCGCDKQPVFVVIPLLIIVIIHCILIGRTCKAKKDACADQNFLQ